MQPATDFIPAATAGRTRVLTGLLTEALDELSPDQTAARTKIATALQMVGGAPRTAPHTGGFAPWQVKRLEARIEAGLEGQLRVDELAGVVRVSRSHFSRAFKKTFHQPFSRYVMVLRLERARRLLAGTDLSISEIALACGLADQSHLTRLFHRQYGAPPSAWRRAHGRSKPARTPGASGDHGQDDPEQRTAVRVVGGGNLSAVFGDDRLADG